MLKYLFLLCCYSSSWVSEVSGEFKVYQPSRVQHFRYVYDHIRANIEGNYVYHPNDRGGQTYGGIARKIHPQWYGWRHVDAVKSIKRHQRVEAAEYWVLDFYLNIWVSEGFDKITDRELALNLFDFRIHSSPRTVELKVNRVLKEMGYCPIKVSGEWINDDFNHLEAKEFVLRLKIHRLILFNYLVRKDQSQYVFYHGWVNRLIETI